ncbi:MAG: hypothetical protein ACRYG8_22220 [Janthinobacterium lividum]
MTDSLSIIHHLIDDKVGKTASQVDDIYRSSNGDLWQLVRETSPNQCLVRHTPNLSSGGAVSDMSVNEFLAINGSGPEHGALRLLLEQE